MLKNKPIDKPKSPFFASGPVKKSNFWALDKLDSALLGRSHRSVQGVQRIKELIDLVGHVLNVPKTHKIAFLSGSATAAVEAALWNFLGPRPVDIVDTDVFSKLWRYDVESELCFDSFCVFETPFDARLNLQHTASHDLVFCLNASTAGTAMHTLDWIQSGEGLVICDATSAAFGMSFDYEKLDVICFGTQKGMGGEASFGILILSPKALHYLENEQAPRGIPRLLNLRRASLKLCEGFVINTPSMLLVEEGLVALKALQEEFGHSPLDGMLQRVEENYNAVCQFVEQQNIFAFVGEESERSRLTAVLNIIDPAFIVLEEKDQRFLLKEMAQMLAEEGAVFDIINHAHQPPSLRFWCGPTINTVDLLEGLPWIVWAYQSACKNRQVSSHSTS